MTVLAWLACSPLRTTSGERDSLDSVPPLVEEDTADATPPPEGLEQVPGYEETVVSYPHLPVLFIETEGPIPTETKVTGTLRVIRDHDGTHTDLDLAPVDLESAIGIEIHGSSSAHMPKHSYRFETRDEAGEDVDVSLLDFPIESDWVLTSNTYDPALLRNGLAFALAHAVSDPVDHYQPRTAWVELYLGGEYVGLYLLTERVKQGDDRVDIDSPDATAEGDITGGYIWKIDYDRGDYWVTAEGTHIGAFYPDTEALTVEQDAYVRGWLDAFEADVKAAKATSEVYGTRIDLDSFVDHTILSELSGNVDAYRLSTYLYKEADDDGGLLYAGPAWDFDRAFGNAYYCGCADPVGFVIDDLTTCGYPYQFAFWWKALHEDPVFQEALRCRWESLRAGVLSDAAIGLAIEAQVAEIADAEPRDLAVWGGPSWVESVDALEAWLLTRTEWLDRHLPGTCP